MDIDGGNGFDDAVAEIYDAALDPDGFGRLADLLAKATQSVNGVVVLRDHMVPVALSATTSAKAADDYLAYYGRIDLWAELTVRSLDRVIASEDVISDEAVLNSEFYVDYARHLGMFHPIGTTCLVSADVRVSIGVNRPHEAPRYGTEEKLRLGRLARHLQRGLQLRQRFNGMRSGARMGFAVLDRLDFAVVVADAEGRAAFVNAPAERLHKEGAGVTLAAGRLGAAIPSEARTLALLVRDAASGGSGGAIRLSDRHGAASLLGLVAPFPQSLGGGDGRTLALATFRRLGANSAAFERAFAQLFGLSPAESQVVSALAAGRSLEEIAHERGVRTTTLRTQLEAIFRKTQTESQRDVVRLFGLLPQMR